MRYCQSLNREPQSCISQLVGLMLMKVSVSWMRIYKDKSVWMPRNRNKIKMHVREIKTVGMHSISFGGVGAALVP